VKAQVVAARAGYRSGDLESAAFTRLWGTTAHRKAMFGD